MRGDVEDTRKRVAYLIRAELVCCDIYEKISVGLFEHERCILEKCDCTRIHNRRRLAARKDGSWHDICYYGEWSARIAESGDLPEHVFYGPSDEHPDSPVTRSDRPRRAPDPRND